MVKKDTSKYYINDNELTELVMLEQRTLYTDIHVNDISSEFNKDLLKIKYENNVLDYKIINKFNKKYVRISVPVNILTDDEVQERNCALVINYNKELTFKKLDLKYISSNKLAEYFLHIESSILKKFNWRNYTQAYKDELTSSANTFFIRYWWKFNPTRMALNYNTIKGEKILKPEQEFKGAFLYFTSLAYSGNLAGIKFLNKSKQSRDVSQVKNDRKAEDIISEMNSGRDQIVYV